MSISERELEENEAKLDNLLHKIVECAKQIQELKENINVSDEESKDFLENIDLLAKTVQELGEAADLIDVTDESITKSVEVEMEDKLDAAIARITAARELVR